jgi:hypothetical protein
MARVRSKGGVVERSEQLSSEDKGRKRGGMEVVWEVA